MTLNEDIVEHSSLPPEGVSCESCERLSNLPGLFYVPPESLSVAW